MLLGEHTAQHPRGFFVQLYALSQQVSGRFVMHLFRGGEQLTGGAHYGFVAFHGATNHFLGGRNIGFFLYAGSPMLRIAEARQG